RQHRQPGRQPPLRPGQRVDQLPFNSCPPTPRISWTTTHPALFPGPGGGFLHHPVGMTAVGGLSRCHWLDSLPPPPGRGRVVRGMTFGVLWGTLFTSGHGGAAGPRRRHRAVPVGSGRPLLAPVVSAASV